MDKPEKQNQNPAGPVDKTAATKNILGVSDDTRVAFSEEHNLNDG
jgi:hypothetical protein